MQSMLTPLRGTSWMGAVAVSLCLCLAANVAGAAGKADKPAQPDHSHVNVSVVVPPGEASGSGDALGIYAVQLVPCEAAVSLGATIGATVITTVGEVASRLLGVFVSVAHANHRERFDGQGAAEFGKRIALDTAATTQVGVLLAPIKRFCNVQLVLARLPAKNGQLELPFSLRLSSSSSPPVTLNYRQDIRIALDKPWVSDGHDAKLKITLRPRGAQAMLQLPDMEEGERMQRIVVRLSADAQASIGR
jgi:hypothetical protein